MSSEKKVPEGMRGFRSLAVLAGLASLVLLVSLPNVYQRLLELLVVAISIYLATLMFRTRHPVYGIVFLVIAVLYLPIFSYASALWAIVAVLSAVWFFFTAVLFKGPPPQPDPDNLPDRMF